MLPPNGQRTSPPSSHACPSSPSRDSHSVRPGRCAHPEPEKDTLLRRHYDYHCCQTTCAHIRSLPSSQTLPFPCTIPTSHAISTSGLSLPPPTSILFTHSLTLSQPPIPALPRHAPTFLFWPLASSICATRRAPSPSFSQTSLLVVRRRIPHPQVASLPGTCIHPRPSTFSNLHDHQHSRRSSPRFKRPSPSLRQTYWQC